LGEPFTHPLRVRYNECDPQGVVFNGNYLIYFDVAITALWREAGGYQQMMAAGLDLVVAEAAVRYLTPLRFDDEFQVAISVAKLGETSMITHYELSRGSEPIADGELRHVFVEAGGERKLPIPEPIRSALGEFTPDPG
jgi:acyl-CoA thioester hydrolase